MAEGCHREPVAGAHDSPGPLERNIVIAAPRRRGTRFPSGLLAGVRPGPGLRRRQQDDVAGEAGHLGALALVPFAVLPAPGAEPPGDMDLVSFPETVPVIPEPVRLPHDDVVPFGFVSPLPVGAAVAAGGGEPEGGQLLAAGQCSEFGVPAEIAQQERLVDGACHAFEASPERPRPQARGAPQPWKRAREPPSGAACGPARSEGIGTGKSALNGAPGTGSEWTEALEGKHSQQSAALGERHERQRARAAFEAVRAYRPT